MNTQLSNLLSNHPNQPSMSSLDLVSFINEVRKAEGNTTELRHATFLEKVREVLCGAEQNFQFYYQGDNGKHLSGCRTEGNFSFYCLTNTF